MKRLVFSLAVVGLALASDSAFAQGRPDGRHGDGPRGTQSPRYSGPQQWQGGDRSPRHWRGDAGDRPYWRDGDRGRHWQGGHRGARDPRWSHRHWGGYWGHHHFSPSPYYWSSYPRWLWAPAVPLFSYAYADWEPPVYVERIIERGPMYVERVPEPPPVEYSERSYAQIAPAPQPAPPPAPARIERITLSATELFEFDKATLRMPQPRLDEIADVMKRNAAIDKVHVTGYTDRLGTDEYNLRLSQKRADAVKAYLVAKGVAAHRLIAQGRGEADPVVQCNDKDRAALIRCLEPNRRVVVEQITVERPASR